MSFPIRQALRAILIGSLLVFAHVLLTTTASSPLVTMGLQFPESITRISSLTFFVLLWQSFSLLESTEALEDPTVVSVSSETTPGVEDKVKEKYSAIIFFGHPVVEGLLNTLLFGYWMVTISDATVILDTLPTVSDNERWFISGSYLIATFSLSILELQTIVGFAAFLLSKTLTASTSRDRREGVSWFRYRQHIGPIHLEEDVEDPREEKSYIRA